jgi:hypothetical protein
MCNESLQISTSEKPDLAYLEDGRLWVATHVGLQSTADGCSWQGVDPVGTVSTQVVQKDPSRPNRVYIASYGQGQGGIRVTEDGGASWTMLMPVPDNDFLRAMRIPPEQPDRVYACGSTFDTTGKQMHYIARSSDRGTSWERSDIAVLDGELSVRLLAVSPKDPEVLLASVTAGEPRVDLERLLVSRDGGKSFSSPLGIKDLKDAAFSADGTTVWVAGLEGLWRSSDDMQTFERIGAAEYMTCVVEHDGKLFAGGYYSGLAAVLDGIGVSADHGDAFQPWMAFKDVADPIDCDPSSFTAMTCTMPQSDWQRERGQFGNGSSSVFPDAGLPASDSGVTQSDAGPTSNAPDAGTTTAGRGGAGKGSVGAGGAGGKDSGTGGHHASSKPGNGCGCALVRGGRSEQAAAASLIFAMLVVARRRIRPPA